jgi:hypothetical protein
MMSAAPTTPVQVEGKGWTMYLGDCLYVIPLIVSVDHVITDPPYSEHVHSKSRSGSRERALHSGSGKKGVKGGARHFKCSFSRAAEFGFDALAPEVRSAAAGLFRQVALRWSIVFSNVEMAGDWRRDLEAAGLDYVRTMAWVKLAATPQFTGDRPAAGFETMTLAHPHGRKRWNGGGKQGVYTCRVAGNQPGGDGVRVHTTQKPEDLMLDLVRDFTDPGEVVLDAFAGSATTGIACLRLGRRFIGIEKDPHYFKVACDRLRAEEEGSTLAAVNAGQTALFGVERP